MGVVCAAGLTALETWAALREGRSAIGLLDADWARECKYHAAAVVRGFDPAAHFEPREMAMLDRFAQFALAACTEAVRNSGLTFSPALPSLRYSMRPLSGRLSPGGLTKRHMAPWRPLQTASESGSMSLPSGPPGSRSRVHPPVAVAIPGLAC